MEEPDVFESPGYRQFLSQWTEWKKATSRSFSLRQFALRAGFSSHAFLPKLLDGSRNLTSTSVEQVISALGLRAAPARYFRVLVQHDQCYEETERQKLFEQLSRIRKVRNRRRLGVAQANYYEHWYYPVLRQIAPWVEPDPVRLGAMLDPPVPASEVRRALEDLVEMGLLVGEGTRLRSPDSLVSVDALPFSAKAKGRHDILQKGIESLHRFAADERSTRCVLLGLSETGWQEAREVLEEAARKCLEIAARDEKPTRVGQVVMQLFPMTRKLSL